MRGLFMCIQVRRPAITHWRNYYQVAGCTSRNINDCHQSVFLNTPRPIHPLDCVNTRLINQENEAKKQKRWTGDLCVSKPPLLLRKRRCRRTTFQTFLRFPSSFFFSPDRKVEPRVSSLCWFFFSLKFLRRPSQIAPVAPIKMQRLYSTTCAFPSILEGSSKLEEDV